MGQRCFDVGAVSAALAADLGVLLIGMEGTAGAEPALLDILRDTDQSVIAGALLQRLGNGCRQNPGRLKADTLIAAQIHPAPVQERAVLLDLHAGDRRVADINSVVAAEQIARLCVQLLIVEVVLAQHLAGGIFTLEMDHKPGQRFGTYVLEGQADGDLAGLITFQQFHPDKLDRAARRIIVGTGLGHQREILIHASLTLLNCCYL